MFNLIKKIFLVCLIIFFIACEGGNSDSPGSDDSPGNETSDSTAPIPGNSGLIIVSSITANSLVLNWDASIDAVTIQSNLSYAVYQSTSSNISTVNQCEKNGVLILDYTTGLLSNNITDLAASTIYYFNVIVKDSAGNKSVYTMKQVSTTAIPDTTAPTPGNSGDITITDVTQSSVHLEWAEGTDDITTQPDLRYTVYRSTSDNISSVQNCKDNGITIMNYTSDVTSFNATGLSAGETYYFNILIKDSAGNENVYDSKSQKTVDPVSIGWVNLQWPNTASGNPGNVLEFYGQVYAEGCTNPSGPGAGITVQFGIGPRDTLCVGNQQWNWYAATYNTNDGNNDEYRYSLILPAAGNYDYIFRFSGDGGNTWLYGDTDGTSSGESPSVDKQGKLTVN